MLLVLSSLVIARYRSLSLVVICVSVSFESDGGVNDRDDSLRSPFSHEIPRSRTGGYVAFPDDDEDCPYEKDDPNLLTNRPVKDRIIVTCAGVAANMVAALAICVVQVGAVGFKEPIYSPGVVLGTINPDTVCIGTNSVVIAEWFSPLCSLHASRSPAGYSLARWLLARPLATRSLARPLATRSFTDRWRRRRGCAREMW